MKTVFEVGQNNESADVLLVELGQDHCCYALLDHEKKTISYLRYMSLEDHEAEECFSDILNDIGAPATEVLFSSSFPQALLVPYNFSGNTVSLLGPFYDLPLQKQMKDSIGEWQMDAVYSLPAGIYDQMVAKFPATRFVHTYTTSLKTNHNRVADDQVELYMTTRHFSVLVKKDHKIQLAQTYTYRSPLDVVYFLLKICYEFGLAQSSVSMIVSGLIEKDSAMYKELHNYFVNLYFAEKPDYDMPQSELPHHYFTSLYNLAACAS